MSAYANDPRVTRVDGAYLVDHHDDADVKRIEPAAEGFWRILSGDRPVGWHPTADEAIRSLIGEPR